MVEETLISTSGKIQSDQSMCVLALAAEDWKASTSKEDIEAEQQQQQLSKQDQEGNNNTNTNKVCKYCNKVLTSGHALGGHLKSHPKHMKKISKKRGLKRVVPHRHAKDIQAPKNSESDGVAALPKWGAKGLRSRCAVCAAAKKMKDYSVSASEASRVIVSIFEIEFRKRSAGEGSCEGGIPAEGMKFEKNGKANLLQETGQLSGSAEGSSSKVSSNKSVLSFDLNNLPPDLEDQVQSESAPTIDDVYHMNMHAAARAKHE